MVTLFCCVKLEPTFYFSSIPERKIAYSPVDFTLDTPSLSAVPKVQVVFCSVLRGTPRLAGVRHGDLGEAGRAKALPRERLRYS